MTPEISDPASRRQDWVGGVKPYLIAWGLPTAAVIAGAFATPGLRAAIWIAALVWMGTACLLNARRCGRVHCRFTGPYYLLLTIPAALLALGIFNPGPYGWYLLGALILFGGKAIWWATETAWGKYFASGQSR